MNGTGECAGARPLLGVYLTGAIAPEDRSVLVRHLPWCDLCRDELAGLAGLPGLLDRAPVRAAAAADGESIAARGLPRGAHRKPGGLLTRRRRWLVAAGAAALAGAALAGFVLRAEPAATVLEARSVGGVPVLTNGAGYTLYWFGSDTATQSNCTGSCLEYWPPVTGPTTAGTGVTGALGAIKRADGSVQATYNGHPLYTASVDTAPGLAKGNDVRTDGGVWHEVNASGPAAPTAGSGLAVGPEVGDEEIADVLDVGGHRLAGGVGVTGGEGVEDGGMIVG